MMVVGDRGAVIWCDNRCRFKRYLESRSGCDLEYRLDSKESDVTASMGAERHPSELEKVDINERTSIASNHRDLKDI